jgi:splicing factor 3A subunit 1
LFFIINNNLFFFFLKITVIKAKLSDLLGGMPAGKQKLVYNDMFVKDSNSLGFYNMMKGSVVYLQLKERGGRKK